MEYSNKFTPNEPTFWRLCDEYICHCDFRLTVNNCVETKALHIINIVDIVWSVIATAIALGILFFRVFFRNQQIFDLTGRFPRPKPIESMALFGVFFNLFRLIHATILITDVAKNGIFRSFMFEFPWQFGITALACYLFGVVHTLACSSKAIYMSWVKSQMFVDIACIVMVVLPFITINPLSILAGYYASINDIDRAITITELIYYLWLTYTFLLGSMVLLAGLRLLRLLNNHLLMQSNESEENIQKIRLGATKVKIIIGIGCFCLWAFSIMIAIYATSRHYVMLSSTFTIILTALALFNGPLATSVIEFAILMDLKMFNGLSNLSFTTTLGSSLTNNHSGGNNSSKQGGDTTFDSTCYITTNKSTSTSETIQMDPWNRFVSKDNNNDTINPQLEKGLDHYQQHEPFRSLSPPPFNLQQQQPQQQQQTQQYGYSLSSFQQQQQQQQQYDHDEYYQSEIIDHSNISVTHLVGKSNHR